MSDPPKSDTLRMLQQFKQRISLAPDDDGQTRKSWNSLLHFMSADSTTNPFKPTDDTAPTTYSKFLTLSTEVPIKRAAEILFDDNIAWNSTYNKDEKDVLLSILIELLRTLEGCLQNITKALEANTFTEKWSRDSTEQVLKKFTDDWVPLFAWKERIWKLTPANQEGLTYYVLKRWLAKDPTNNEAWKQYKNILGNGRFIPRKQTN